MTKITNCLSFFLVSFPVWQPKRIIKRKCVLYASIVSLLALLVLTFLKDLTALTYLCFQKHGTSGSFLVPESVIPIYGYQDEIDWFVLWNSQCPTGRKRSLFVFPVDDVVKGVAALTHARCRQKARGLPYRLCGADFIRGFAVVLRSKPFSFPPLSAYHPSEVEAP